MDNVNPIRVQSRCQYGDKRLQKKNEKGLTARIKMDRAGGGLEEAENMWKDKFCHCNEGPSLKRVKLR